MTEQERQAALDALGTAMNMAVHTDRSRIKGGVMLLDFLHENVINTIRAALSSPAVPVIEGLDEAIYVLKDLLLTNELHDRDKSRFEKILKAARAYAAMPKLQKVDLKHAERLFMEGKPGYKDGYNRAIDDIKSKYGELYAEVKE